MIEDENEGMKAERCGKEGHGEKEGQIGDGMAVQAEEGLPLSENSGPWSSLHYINERGEEVGISPNKAGGESSSFSIPSPRRCLPSQQQLLAKWRYS